MMTTTTRITLVLVALLSAGLSAQERLGSAALQPSFRGRLDVHAGDGLRRGLRRQRLAVRRQQRRGAERRLVTHALPGRRPSLRRPAHDDATWATAAAFSNYQTFSVLNRWDQRAKFELRRQESARVEWFGRASAAMMPTTDLLELGGIPFRHTGARTFDGRGGIEYAINGEELALDTR